MTPQSEYLDTHQCARLIGRSASTVREWRSKNAKSRRYQKGPRYDKNPTTGQVRYKRVDVALWMRRHGGYVPGIK